MKDLTGKVAVISGGSAGIGLAMAEACACAGMEVVLGYRSTSHLKAALETLDAFASRVHPVALDVTRRDQVADAVATITARLGDIHLLIANAGIASTVSIGSADAAHWDEMLEVNVTGVFNCVNAFLPNMKAHGGPAHIVAMSSVAGLSASASMGVYSASKAAVIAMMEALHDELAGIRVGVSVCCPGPVDTQILAGERTAQWASQSKGMDAAAIARAMQDLRDKGILIDPATVADRVLDGVREEALYILTHDGLEELLHARRDALLRASQRLVAGQAAAGE